MLEHIPDSASLAFVLLGALAAGFTTGFAGFGTGLVASGLWFHALPAPLVPPLVALAAVVAQLVGLATVRHAFEWNRAAPFLLGGVLGVPVGVAVLSLSSPDTLRLSVGLFLAGYAGFQLFGLARRGIGDWGGRSADSMIGVAGGFLGGFAGLSGALPLVWLQMRGGPSARQRATYQPFNLIVLGLASLGMALSGALDARVLTISALCLPVTVAGAWLGARVYTGVSETAFRRIVLVLLLVSGAILVTQGIV
ncbi:MAG: sulfite exporter TauE/SafE family protein [Alphaproteobacteria bacterium]